MTARLDWGQNQTAVVRRGQELAAFLERLREDAARTRPFVAILTLENGESLGLGLGREFSVLEFDSGSGQPPYYESVGASDSDAESVVEFDFGGEPTEFAETAAIPTETAIAALVAFFETGRLPEFVQWREV